MGKRMAIPYTRSMATAAEEEECRKVVNSSLIWRSVSRAKPRSLNKTCQMKC